MALKPVTVSQLNEYISRVLMTDPKHPLLQEFYQYMRKYFPGFEKNRYVAQLPRSKKLAFNLLLHRRYRLLATLFRAKNRVGG